MSLTSDEREAVERAEAERAARVAQAANILDRVEELRWLSTAATPGDWTVDEGRWAPPGWEDGTAYLRIVAGDPNPVSGIYPPVLSTGGAPEGTPEDARHYADTNLTVAAVNLVRELLAAAL